MPKRKLLNEEKKLPASFSIEPKLKFEFNKLCYDLESDPSKEIRRFMKSFIEKNKTLIEKKHE